MNSSLAVAAAVFLSAPIASPQSAAPPAENQNELRFTAETDLVLVPVVVRDAQGNAVGNLRKEDFQVFDKGKPQVITKFAVEDTEMGVAPDRSLPAEDRAPRNAAAMTIPEHFIALLFDDLHMKSGPGNIGDFGDLVYSRDAALKFLDTMQPADRMAIFTTSGEVMVDFTFDRAKLKAALLKLRVAIPNPPMGSACQIQGDIERESRAVVTQSGNIVRRMARLMGQRTVVLISSGLILYNQGPCAWSLVRETMQLIGDAVRSQVVFNGLDARGLAIKSGFSFQMFQAQMTEGTGGRFIADTNDLKGAMRRLAATPNYIYVLGFSPQMLKPDGSFHTLTVRLVSGHKLDVQTRKGYWAPDVKELARRQKAPPAAEKAEAPRMDERHGELAAEAMDIAPIAANRPELAETTVVTGPSAVTPPAAPPGNDEVTTHDQPVTFKAESNLVEVPVVVRDGQGHAIGSLRKEDFRVYDKGKRQGITKFSIQKAGGQPLPDGSGPVTSGSAPGGPVGGGPPLLPNRFVAFVFDDLHMRFEDLPQVRAAVQRFIRSSLGPQDRVALFTTSGRIGVNFTERSDEFNESLLKIAPNPVRAPDLSSCGAYVSYFQAVQVDQQVGLQPRLEDLPKSLPLRVAVAEIGDFNNAVMEIRDAYTSGLQETRATLAALKIVVQRMAAMPGQRSVVLVSPGFFVPPDLQNVSSDLTQLAIRSRVVIGGVDARGVWTIPAFNACQPGAPASTIQDEVALRQIELEANTDELVALAEDTGGALNRNNDFDGGVRKAAAAPEYLYVLGFVPQNLKFDGSFHTLKVTLTSGEKGSLQTRRGYWAPKHAEDALEAARQEIESAVFSRDEIHNLPVEMHTQVLKAGDGEKLNVLTSLDLKQIHLRKADDRNRNDVTIVAAVFDSNGNFIAGKQKVLQLRLRDETVSGLEQRPPVTIDTNFDMQPGAYLVRLVVRDAEDQQFTAENAGVLVP